MIWNKKKNTQHGSVGAAAAQCVLYMFGVAAEAIVGFVWRSAVLNLRHGSECLEWHFNAFFWGDICLEEKKGWGKKSNENILSRFAWVQPPLFLQSRCSLITLDHFALNKRTKKKPGWLIYFCFSPTLNCFHSGRASVLVGVQQRPSIRSRWWSSGWCVVSVLRDFSKMEILWVTDSYFLLFF